MNTVDINKTNSSTNSLKSSFLFQLTNDLCTSFTKIVIILLLSKAVFLRWPIPATVKIFLSRYYEIVNS